MGKLERVLEFTSMELGLPMSGRCDVCKRVFIAKPKDGETYDAISLRLEADFAIHNCEEDASPAKAFESPVNSSI
jgi:hypothetical protein